MAARESSQTLDRALRLLDVLSVTGPRTVTELAGALDVARPVVYRLVATLRDRGMVTSDEGGRYRLGLGMLRLSDGVLPGVRAVAEPILRRLADEVGATAHLTVADGEDAVALAVVEPSSTTFHVGYRTGARHPLERGAAGRAILGGRTRRPRRWYVSTGELQPGATGLAVPLRHPYLDASVGVVSFGDLPPGPTAAAVIRTATALDAALR